MQTVSALVQNEIALRLNEFGVGLNEIAPVRNDFALVLIDSTLVQNEIALVRNDFAPVLIDSTLVQNEIALALKWVCRRFLFYICIIMRKLYILISLIIALNCYGQSPALGVGGVGYAGNLGDGFYWGTTIAFSAINGTTTYFNIKKLNTPDKYKENAIVGTLSGATQATIGFFGLTDKNLYAPAVINIGFGLTTVVTSIIRLANKRPPKEDKVTFNFFYLPPFEHNTATCGLRFVGRLN